MTIFFSNEARPSSIDPERAKIPLKSRPRRGEEKGLISGYKMVKKVARKKC